MNGFGISSLPSTGEMTTRRVPRATIRPSLRYLMLPSSSGSSQIGRCEHEDQRHTSQRFFDLIQDKVHELVVAFERANDCKRLAPALLPNCPALHTFSSATELDGDLLVHVLAQVKNVLFLRALSLSARTARLCTATTATSSPAVAAPTSASTPECASLRHGSSVERKRRVLDVEACGDVQQPRPVRGCGLCRSGKGSSHPTFRSRAWLWCQATQGWKHDFRHASRPPPCCGACIVAARFTQDAWACGIFRHPSRRRRRQPGVLGAGLFFRRHLTHFCHRLAGVCK